MTLDGKVALITGSTRGIGKSTALLLAANGANLILNYKKNSSDAEETRKQVETQGREVSVIQADVTKPEEFKRMVDEVIGTFGRLDILINNADDDQFVCESPASYSEEQWHLTIQGSLYSTYYGCKYAIEVMRRQGGGRIVNISAAGDKDFELASLCLPYYVAKAGIKMLTKMLAVSEAKNNITVNCVSPGFIDNYQYSDELLEMLRKTIPVGTLGTPDQVASAILFLVSDENTYINGADIPVGGGV